MARMFLLLLVFLINFKFYAQGSVIDWSTHFEKSGFIETSRYDQSVAYFKQFEKYSPYIKTKIIGTSPQGRNIYCLVAAKGKEFTSDAAQKSGKAIVLIENSIHSGEVEGKDACMLLLREILISKEKENLLDNVIFLIIPVINVDGHERISKYNRINQNGPLETGWRTTAQNLNLNRDFMKADAPEMRAFLKLYSEWLPDFFIDSHTTDGADYQYTVTYSVEHNQNIYEKTGSYLKKEFIPFFESYVENDGFLVSPYTSFKDGIISNGIMDWAAMPRLSNGYAAIQNRPSLLIETHMLKTYKDRVFSTKSSICAVLEFANKNYEKLKKINSEADLGSIEELIGKHKAFPVSIKNTGKTNSSFIYKGFKAVYDSSWITGKNIIRYTDEKYSMQIPYYNNMYVADSVYLPMKYIIPCQWQEVIDKTKLHGIKGDRLKKFGKFIVERIKFKNVKFSSKPYEGRMQPEFDFDIYKDTVTVDPGDYIIDTRQRSLRVIGALLEPKSPDSFIKWGLFNSIFEEKEYFEDYSMEPIAREMAEKNLKLKQQFLDKVKQDKAFRDDEHARLNFFYEHSPYYDERYNVYPVMRILEDNQ